MTKADIVEGVYDKLGGFSKKEAAAMVETILDVIKAALVAGDKVKISRFGAFSVRAKKKRRGRNPKTGTPLDIEPRRVLTFKPSQALKKMLNS